MKRPVPLIHVNVCVCLLQLQLCSRSQKWTRSLRVRLAAYKTTFSFWPSTLACEVTTEVYASHRTISSKTQWGLSVCNYVYATCSPGNHHWIKILFRISVHRLLKTRTFTCTSCIEFTAELLFFFSLIPSTEICGNGGYIFLSFHKRKGVQHRWIHAHNETMNTFAVKCHWRLDVIVINHHYSWYSTKLFEDIGIVLNFKVAALRQKQRITWAWSKMIMMLLLTLPKWSI